MSGATDQIDALLSYVRDNGRVCPLPQQWDMLYKLLTGSQFKGAASKVPAPLILSAWWNSTDQDKCLRLKKHIEIAKETGVLESTDNFLRSLPPDAWHYVSDD